MNQHELDECLELLHRAVRRVVTAPQALLATRKLGRAHHRTLFYIRREPGIAVGDLAQRTAVTNQALHKTLRDLIAIGFVRSAPNPENRRSRQLTLTPAGRRFEARISGMQRDALAAAFGTLGRERIERWAEATRAIAETAAAGPGGRR